MKCCPLSHLPKKYLCFAKNQDGEVVQCFLSEEEYLRFQKLAKEYPGVQLVIK